MVGEAQAEQFSHGADIGVRGIGPTMAAAFEGAALALASAVTDVSKHDERDRGRM